MGDELVVDVFGTVLTESLRQQAAMVATNVTPRVSLEYQYGGILQVDANGQMQRVVRRPSINYTAFNFAVLGGGSLLEPVQTIWAPFCKAARSTGLALYLHATGTQLSTQSKRDTQALRCVRRPTFGGLRGPLTSAMLVDLANVWSRSNPGSDIRRHFDLDLPIISDSGILASRIFPRHIVPVVDMVDVHRTPAGVVCISGFPQGLDAARLVRAWAYKYTVVLMPVDHMNLVRASDLLGDIVNLEPSLKNRVFLNHHLTNYGVWLALLDRCNVMLTSRLHAMILSASAQRPFRIFDEARKSQLKMQDFINNTFAESIDKFKLPRGWRGSMPELDAVMRDSATNWKTRYTETYEQIAIERAYQMHLAAMGKFLRFLMPRGTGFHNFTDIRVSIRRHYDGATMKLMFR